MGPLRPLRPADLHELRDAGAGRPRCKTCGKPARDALASMRPNQVAIGVLVAGARRRRRLFRCAVRLVHDRRRILRGTLIAEALDRTVGIKRGPRILAIAVAGILVGGLIGGAFSLAGLWREMQAFAASPEAEGMPAYPLDASSCNTSRRS